MSYQLISWLSLVGAGIVAIFVYLLTRARGSPKIGEDTIVGNVLGLGAAFLSLVVAILLAVFLNARVALSLIERFGKIRALQTLQYLHKGAIDAAQIFLASVVLIAVAFALSAFFRRRQEQEKE